MPARCADGQSTVTIQVPFRRSDGHLNLLVDSTGVKTRGGEQDRGRSAATQAL